MSYNLTIEMQRKGGDMTNRRLTKDNPGSSKAHQKNKTAIKPPRVGGERISKALERIARNNLKEFESQTDKAFLARMALDRKLGHL